MQIVATSRHGKRGIQQPDHRPFGFGRQHFGIKEIGHADKVGDEFAGRLLVDLGRFTDLFDFSMVHYDDLVGQAHRLGLVVGDVDAGQAELALDLADFPPHVDPQLGVEIGQRLVKQQYRGFHDQCPGQGDPLLLAT